MLWKCCTQYASEFGKKSPSGQGSGFSSGHIWMWDLDYKESWAPKNWCFWTVVLEKTLESPLDCKEIQPVHPKGNQSWIFIGLMLKLKLQYFGHLMWRANSFEKTLMLGKIEDRRRRGWHRMRCWMASPTPGAYSNSCPLSRWHHSTISSSVIPFSSCHPLLLLSSIFTSVRVFSNESALRIRWPSIGASASASVLPVNTQGWRTDLLQ